MFLFTALVGTFFTILLMAYFFPYMIALWGGSRNLQFIAVLNLLFGWCIVGWFAALLWAFKGSEGKSKIGRIVLLMSILIALGYLLAFATGTLCSGVADRFYAATHVEKQY
jgi:hypothetical protein